jgi:hypothetical protein
MAATLNNEYREVLKALRVLDEAGWETHFNELHTKAMALIDKLRAHQQKTSVVKNKPIIDVMIKNLNDHFEPAMFSEGSDIE